MALVLEPKGFDIDIIPGVDEIVEWFVQKRASVEILNVSATNPAVVTTAEDSCFVNGDRVAIYDTHCCPRIEDLGEVWTVTGINGNTFSVPANVSLHSGAGGIVAGPLIDLSSYTITAAIYQKTKVTKNRFLNAFADANAGSSRVILKSDDLAEISRQWLDITVVNTGIDDFTYTASPIQDACGCCGAYIPTADSPWRYTRVLTVSGSALTDQVNTRVRGSYREETGAISKFADVLVNVTPLNGKVSLFFPKTQLATINEIMDVYVYATDIAGRTSLIGIGTVGPNNDG